MAEQGTVNPWVVGSSPTSPAIVYNKRMDEIAQRFTKIAAEILTVNESKITPEARLQEDLQADSLDIIELVMALEEEFQVTVASAELDEVETVGQALELIRTKVK